MNKKVKKVGFMIFVILLYCLYSCNSKIDDPVYTIQKEQKTLLDNENCHITFSYPKVLHSKLKKGEDTLNQFFEMYGRNTIEHYANHCHFEKMRVKPKDIVSCSFNVLLKEDSLLYVEFTVYKNYGGNPLETDTTYHPALINMKNGKFILAEDLIPNFDKKLF